MTPAAKSVYVFGWYLNVLGLLLMIIPNTVLSLLQMPEAREVWIRVVGVLVFCIGFYYHRTGVAHMHSFYKLTIPTRILVFLSFSVFALLNYASPVLIFFGAIDLAGAIWTWQSLRRG